jgi:serine/threonine protein kinase
MEGKIVANNYKLVKKLGSGAFGQIWKAEHLKTKEQVAIKFEDVNSKHQ